MHLSTATLALVVLACGVGTFCLRLWPMLLHRSGGAARLGPRLRRVLAALGPAAITALLLAALWPQLAVPQPWWPALRVLGGLGAIALARAIGKGGVAVPTLAGVLVYGVLQWLAA